MAVREHTGHHVAERRGPTVGQAVAVAVVALGLGFIMTPATSAVGTVVATLGS